MNKNDNRRATWMKLPPEEVAAKREYEKIRMEKPDRCNPPKPKFRFKLRFAEK